MPRTQVACPQCRTPVAAEVEQLFDVGVEPQAKQKLLNGSVNVIQCPNCRFQGQIPVPIVYHDPSKELLLTYFPPELNTPVMEQERQIAPFMNRVVNSLKQEERKAYLFKPQQMFTYQNLIEKVLEGEGITKEMLQAQQKRVELLQSLLTAPEDGLVELVKQNADTVDADFFTLLSRMLQAGLGAGDEKAAVRLGQIQEALLENTDLGKQIKQQADEIEAARAALEGVGAELTREKLLELLLAAAESDARLSAMVSMARPGLDYVFFQQLSEQIEKAGEDEKAKLSSLREKLLEMTRQIDEQMQVRVGAAQRNLEAMLAAENPVELLQQNPAILDELFVQVINQSLQEAAEKKDGERLQKLQRLAMLIQQLINPGYNPALLEELIEAPDDATRAKVAAENSESITPEFLESLSAMMAQLQESPDKELAEKVRQAYRAALKASMQKGMQGQ
ncbi:MAG: CpXC domain-containing protein [Anaerolineales bacterium]|nr:MAG: CpXC domain-containing protein [Anaerolineales bacterium]